MSLHRYLPYVPGRQGALVEGRLTRQEIAEVFTNPTHLWLAGYGDRRARWLM